MPPLLLVLSPSRWDFMFRRTQQLMSRLAGRWQVLFVEEPRRSRNAAWLDEQAQGEHLSVLVPHLPANLSPHLPPSLDATHDEPRRMLAAYLRQRDLRVDVAWVSSPASLPLLDSLDARCVVYDCHASSTAPRLRREQALLLERSTLVFANGPSLYESLREQHPRVMCLPDAVAAAHFAPDAQRPHSVQAMHAGSLQRHLSAPRLGWFGVIDRRLDLDLLAQIADAHPQWSLVMVGPVVGLDASRLPQRANIHWLGVQPYSVLPHLLEGWDLCLLPFVIGAATRQLCPAQALEYMAGGKPVLCTPLHDVAWMFSDSVAIAERGPPFIAACEALLAESPAQRAQRALQMMATVSASSWDRSAQAVHEMLHTALASRRRGAASASIEYAAAPAALAATAPALEAALPVARTHHAAQAPLR